MARMHLGPVVCNLQIQVCISISDCTHMCLWNLAPSATAATSYAAMPADIHTPRPHGTKEVLSCWLPCASWCSAPVMEDGGWDIPAACQMLSHGLGDAQATSSSPAPEALLLLCEPHL